MIRVYTTVHFFSIYHLLFTCKDSYFKSFNGKLNHSSNVFLQELLPRCTAQGLPREPVTTLMSLTTPATCLLELRNTGTVHRDTVGGWGVSYSVSKIWRL